MEENTWLLKDRKGSFSSSGPGTCCHNQIDKPTDLGLHPRPSHLWVKTYAPASVTHRALEYFFGSPQNSTIFFFCAFEDPFLSWECPTASELLVADLMKLAVVASNTSCFNVACLESYWVHSFIWGSICVFPLMAHALPLCLVCSFSGHCL